MKDESIRWHKEKGILIREGAEHWKYPLRNISSPNLLRDIFPYELIPKIDFDNNVLPLNPAPERWITDTTFRDGQQARPPYSVRQIVDIFTLLSRLGGPNGIIRQSEFFLYSDKDKQAVETCKNLNLPFPEITGWIRAREEDFEIVKELGLKETGILTSVSDYHIFLKLKKNRSRVIKDYLKVVSKSLENGIIPRCHFEDVTRADIFGFVIPFAYQLMQLAREAQMPVKIRLCDTMGFGVPYSQACLPRSIPKLINVMITEADVPKEWLEWHGHNDFHKVLVNATTAWLFGCSSANGTLLGFGERTGNPPIEGLIIDYISLLGEENGINTQVITEIANYFSEEIGVNIPSNYPFVGAGFNATSAGIHLDGIAKNEEIYNIFNTDRILSRPMGIIINDKSGTAGIAQWVNRHLRLEKSRRVDKRNPGVAKINRKVVELFQKGRVAGISDDEMDKLAEKYLPGYFISRFDRMKKRAFDMSAHLIIELTQADEFRSKSAKQIQPKLDKFVDLNPFIIFAYVVDADGKLIYSKVGDKDYASGYEKTDIPLTGNEKLWFKGPFKDGKIHISDLYTSKITGLLILTVSMPIFDKNSNIIGVTGLDIRFEQLQKAEREDEMLLGATEDVPEYVKEEV